MYPASDPSSRPHQSTSSDERLQLISVRAARAVFAISGLMAAVGSLLLAWAYVSGYEQTAPASVLWLSFALISFGLCFLPSERVRQSGLAAFLALGITALLINAVLRAQGVQTVGLIFLPLLLLPTALLCRPIHAWLLTLWSVVGLLVLYNGQSLNLWKTLDPPPEAFVSLVGLLLACAMAVFVGMRIAMRFAQAERLSVQHEMRYRDLFDRLPSGVVLHDKATVLDANRAALQMVGEPRRDAFIGRDLRDYIADETSRTEFLARLEQLIEGLPGDTLPATDAMVVRKGQAPVRVRTTTTILRETQRHTALGFLLGNETGQRPLFLSFMLDDTVRHKAQADMVRVKTLLEAVLSNSPYAFSLTRKSDGLIVECNTAYEALVGRSRAELIERSSLDLGIWARPEDRTRFIAGLEAGGRGDAEQVLRFVDAAGKHRLVKGRGAFVSFDGQDYVLLMGRDVTESTRREAEQQTVLQNAPLGVATTLGNVIVSANPRVHDIFRVPQGTLVGMRTRDLWMSRNRHDRLEERVLNDLITNGGARFEETFSPDDEQTTLRLIGSVLPDTEEGPRRVVWIVEDITQERLTEKALQATAQAAKAASLAKSAFLANMSHELRTPLNGILGLLDLALESESDTTVQRHQVELARESSRVLSDLLNDVLDLSRIEAGRLEIESTPFDLRRLLDSVRTVHEVLAESRGLLLRFEVHLGPNPQVWVLGDPTRVRQILNNYLSNALKFTATGEVVVRVGRRSGPADQGPVQMEVLDTGPGITPAVQSRLFSAFEQGDASAARRQGGSGLGLAICRELATLMQGQVGVESEPGRGSRFWVELPLPPSAPADSALAAQAPTPDLSGLRVLVAEDNQVNMLITTAMLEPAGARVTGVSNGQAALHAVLQADAQDDAFSLLLMDIQMPDMDGLQATQALRLTHGASRLPIIALTAGALQTERDAALQAGMDDFVTKPVDRVHLLACVARHAVRHSSPSISSTPSTSLLA